MIEKWLHKISEEDRTFIKRFVLSSGSLKELAKQYQVSYPTLRLRLDRLIEKIKLIEDDSEKDLFKKKIRIMVTEGKLSFSVAKEILKAYQKRKED